MHFSVAIVLFDIEIYVTLTPMKFLRSVSFSDLAKGQLPVNISKGLHLENEWVNVDSISAARQNVK